MPKDLLGVGLYSPAEAGRLLRIPPGRIRRWLRGHAANGKWYAPLWEPEVQIGDDKVHLGFRDLMEARLVDAFIRLGISAIQMRRAIQVATEVLGQDHPLATNRFKTDGRDVFLRVGEMDDESEERERLLSLFSRQYVFKEIVDPVLHSVDFGDDGGARLWWPLGRDQGVVVDPGRSFGAPIDSVSSVPTEVLAEQAAAFGVEDTAQAYAVPASSVERAVEFEAWRGQKLAA